MVKLLNKGKTTGIYGQKQRIIEKERVFLERLEASGIEVSKIPKKFLDFSDIRPNESSGFFENLFSHEDDECVDVFLLTAKPKITKSKAMR